MQQNFGLSLVILIRNSNNQIDLKLNILYNNDDHIAILRNLVHILYIYFIDDMNRYMAKLMYKEIWYLFYIFMLNY